MTTRRSQRSTSAPANGPITMPGIMVIIVASASTVAEPVDCVSHQIMPRPARLVPNSENACPIQIVKKRNFQFDPTSMVLFLYDRSLPQCTGVRSAAHHTEVEYAVEDDR